MKSRTQRILAIRRIIGKEAITNQEELLSILKREGYDVTQATLSRDLKFLEAGKIAGRFSQGRCSRTTGRPAWGISP